MPKRSNQFQKLVTYIAEQVAPVGATVQESAELYEKGLDAKVSREVDVLIEANGGMATIRIALECRDRSRKDDIQWIDDLIGKYQNLEVNQVIAVSSSGFSQTAQQKAEFNRIVTMSLEEASETNWPEQFVKLGIGMVNQHLQVIKLLFVTDPPFQEEIAPDDKIYFMSTHPPEIEMEPEVMDMKSFVAKVDLHILNQIKKYMSSNMLSIYKTLENLGKDALVEWPLSVSNLQLEGKQADRYEIRRMVYTVLIRTEYLEVGFKNHLLSDKAMITSATLDPGDGNKISLSVVQANGSAEGKLFVNKSN
ncbi:hypothetical protein AWQ24_11125 [Picosynechococcus sp. PCC 8807]|nr:hypothetical protein AWQ24_11125 [Picosynechococcus sp. PCC 8807]